MRVYRWCRIAAVATAAVGVWGCQRSEVPHDVAAGNASLVVLSRDTALRLMTGRSPRGVVALSSREFVVWYSDSARIDHWHGEWSRIEVPRLNGLVGVGAAGRRVVMVDSTGTMLVGQLDSPVQWQQQQLVGLRAHERLESMAADPELDGVWTATRLRDSTLVVQYRVMGEQSPTIERGLLGLGAAVLSAPRGLDAVIISEAAAPFRVQLLTRNGQITEMSRGALNAMVDTQDRGRDEVGLWRLMRPVQVEGGLLFTLSDVRTLRRVIVTSTNDLQVRGCKTLEAPFALATSTPDLRSVVAGQWDRSPLLVVFSARKSANAQRTRTLNECSRAL